WRAVIDRGALVVQLQPEAKALPAPFGGPPLRPETRQVQQERVDSPERQAGQGVRRRAVVAVAQPGPTPRHLASYQARQDAVCDLLADLVGHGGLQQRELCGVQYGLRAADLRNS